jgi:hypothetical protein
MKTAAGVNDVAACILGYLLETAPKAEDTIDGIVEWWVMRQRIRYETARVKEALSELVSEGLIVERRVPGSTERYRINKRKMPAIRAYLAGLEGSSRIKKRAN